MRHFPTSSFQLLNQSSKRQRVSLKKHLHTAKYLLFQRVMPPLYCPTILFSHVPTSPFRVLFTFGLNRMHDILFLFLNILSFNIVPSFWTSYLEKENVFLFIYTSLSSGSLRKDYATTVYPFLTIHYHTCKYYMSNLESSYFW